MRRLGDRGVRITRRRVTTIRFRSRSTVGLRTTSSMSVAMIESTAAGE